MDQTGQVNKLTHRIHRIILIVAAIVAFIVVAFFNSLAGNSLGGDLGLFLNSTGVVSAVYYTEITPAGWAFLIWAVIYIWQVMWLLYAFANIFRHTNDGYLYYSPDIVSAPVLIIYIINMGLNVCWLFLWDRSVQNMPLLVVSVLFLFLISISLYACIFLSHRDLDQNAEALLEDEKSVDIWLVRVFLHNGLSIYAAWGSVAQLLNLAIAVAYHSNSWSQHDASTLALGLLLAEITIYVTLDLCLFDRYTRYTLTPYLVFIWALSASLVKNYILGSRNGIFTAVLLAASIAVAILKIILMCVRHRKRPLYQDGFVISSKQGEISKES